MRRRAPSPTANPTLYAKNKVMDLLASRDHSEKELRTKLHESFRRSGRARQRLNDKTIEPTSDEDKNQQTKYLAAIDEAIEFARVNGWLGSPEEISKKMANLLHRRKKGIRYINNYLQGKGLPEVNSDRDLELEKALALVKNKVSILSELSFAEKQKEQARIGRFLISRGFDSETVRKVIYEKLRD